MSLRPANYQEALERKRASDARKREKALNLPSQHRNSGKLGCKPFRAGNATQGLKARKRAINRVGPRTRESDKAREWLKREFNKVGIRTCQLRLAGCWFDTALGFAHPAKRRNLQDGELYIAALLCNPCHDIIEVGDPQEMRRIVEMLFAQTGIRQHNLRG